MRTVWNDDHEPVGFEPEVAGVPAEMEIPPEAIAADATTAAVIMNGLNKLERPVFLFPRAARELEQAGVLRRDVDEATLDLGQLKVFLYGGPW